MILKSKFGAIIQNLSYTFSSNSVNLLTSFFIVFFIPKFIGVESYAYWQLYIFYTTYLQYFTFGIPEGIYLEYGGYELDDLPKKKLRNQYGNLLISSFILILVINSIFSLFINLDFDKTIVTLLSSGALILIVPRTVLTFELQATNEIKKFSFSMILEKICLLIGILVLILFKHTEYWKFIIIDLLSKGITNVYILKVCKKFVFGEYSNFILGIKDSFLFMKSGINITLSNISSILVMGIIRFIIEIVWSIKTFGEISLIISMNNMIMVFINSVSIVLFPILKKVKSSNLKMKFMRIDLYSSYGALNITLLFFPIYTFLYYFLPEYRDALKYMALIFPMTIFESQIGIFYNTYLKTFRKENVIFKVNALMVLITLISIVPVGMIWKSLSGSVLLILIISVLKYLFLKRYLYSYCVGENSRYTVIPIIFVLLFLFSFNVYNVVTSFFVVLIILLGIDIFLYLKLKSQKVS